MSKALLRVIFVGLGLSVLGVACSEQSNSIPAGADAILNPVAPAATLPEGPFPRGTVDPNNQLDPATQGPEIAVVSPERGAQVAGPNQTIRVRVEDPNGIKGVEIAGVPATDIGLGEFEATVPLDHNAMNYMVVEAEDMLGNRSDANFTLVCGQFLGSDDFMNSAMGVSLSNPGLARVGQIAEGLAANLDLFPAIQAFNPILDNFLAEISVTSLAHKPVKLAISGAQDGAEIKVHLDDIRIGVLIDTIINQDATLLADRMTVAIQARIDPNGNPSDPSIRSALGLTIQNVDVSFVNFDVTVPQSLLNTIVGLLRGFVRNFVEDTLEEELVGVIDGLLGNAMPGLGTPITVDLPLPGLGSSSIDVSLCAHDADGSAATGLGMALGCKAVATNPVLASNDGIFFTGTQARPTVMLGDDFAVGLSSDAFNTFLHAMWMSGAMKFRMDGTQPNPGSTFSVSAKLLYPFFPQLRGIAPDGNTPLVIEVSSVKCPEARFGQNGASIALTAGEFEVKILIDFMDNQAPLEVLTLRACLQLAADITFENNELKITRLEATHVAADLMSEPVTNLADDELENFVNAILPFMLDKFTDRLPSIPVPALPFGLQLQNPRIDFEPDFLILRGGL